LNAQVKGTPIFKIPDIGGEIYRVRLDSFGSVLRKSGDRMVVCEVALDLTLHNPEPEPIQIRKLMLTAWPERQRPVNTLKIRSDIGDSFMLSEGNHGFSVNAQIEFLDDGSNTIPQSLWVLAVDQYNAKHFIPRREGVALPVLAGTVT
jgi:hypothetical protein